MKKKITLLLLTGIVFTIGCVTPAEKGKENQVKKTSTEQKTDTHETREIEIKFQLPPPETKPLKPIPSYPENRTYSEVMGGSEYIVGTSDVLAITSWKGTMHNPRDSSYSCKT